MSPQPAIAVPAGYPDGCIHELFERQAARSPDATALIDSNERVSFAELNRRANQIAHSLANRGVGREVFVGICAERSISAIVAVIGVLKAGGAYVYFDPAYPVRRLREMALDSGLKLVIANDEFRKRVFGDPAGMSFLDPGSSELSQQSASNMACRSSLDDAAYVIYTSGSTGRPKGIVQVHRSMTSRLISVPLPDIQDSDVCCLNSSLSFGISTSRLFFPLVLGSPVVVIEDEVVKDVPRFVGALESNRVTSVFMVPALLRQVLKVQARAGGLRFVRAVATSGGALTPDLIEGFRRQISQAHLINVYGSTEIGTAASLRVIGSSTPSGPASIGSPVANTKIHILDSGSNPAPPGTVGEICVSAAHLAREYLNDPGQTAKRFAPDPIEQDARWRICRTGDLGRYLPNGEIEFLGRVDHQVKIRGYRIEPEEIEAVLLGHTGVDDAVVVARGVREKVLVAYVAGRDPACLDRLSLSRFLRDRLPEYMIPSVFVALHELPRTDAGKVDRHALPEPPEASAECPPETEVESVLANLWSELLRVERVSIRDNFIEHGGDSLAVAQLVAMIRGQWGAEIPARLIFDATLGEIAREIQRQCSAIR